DCRLGQSYDISQCDDHIGAVVLWHPGSFGNWGRPHASERSGLGSASQNLELVAGFRNEPINDVKLQPPAKTGGAADKQLIKLGTGRTSSYFQTQSSGRRLLIIHAKGKYARKVAGIHSAAIAHLCVDGSKTLECSALQIKDYPAEHCACVHRCGPERLHPITRKTQSSRFDFHHPIVIEIR